jgi:hypothetical protein
MQHVARAKTKNSQVWNDDKTNDEVTNRNAEAPIDNEVAAPSRGNDIAAEGPAPLRWIPPTEWVAATSPYLTTCC